MPEASLSVILISHTPEPEKVCAAAARQCYKNVGSAELMATGKDEIKVLERVI